VYEFILFFFSETLPFGGRAAGASVRPEAAVDAGQSEPSAQTSAPQPSRPQAKPLREYFTSDLDGETSFNSTQNQKKK